MSTVVIIRHAYQKLWNIPKTHQLWNDFKSINNFISDSGDNLSSDIIWYEYWNTENNLFTPAHAFLTTDIRLTLSLDRHDTAVKKYLWRHQITTVHYFRLIFPLNRVASCCVQIHWKQFYQNKFIVIQLPFYNKAPEYILSTNVNLQKRASALSYPGNIHIC